jgi:3-hydroxyisobutyrate dehydrogenase-like beta-hydroxyacid dehydrogenase
MAKLAFLGLGLMGAPMAARLLEAGHEVTVWNRTAQRAGPLVTQGASQAPTPARAVAGAEVVITMLADPRALEAVVFGDDGLATALAPGQLYVDMSTVGLDAFRSVAGRLPQGVTMVDAPVRGSIPQATSGQLAIFVGASQADFEAVAPVLAPMGSVHRVGGPGAGAAAKLVVNSTLGATIAALGEALALGEAFGLDRVALLDVLADSAIGATVKAKRANVESGDYPATFKLSLALKDMRLVGEAAAEAGRELKVAEAARQWLEQADRDGEGDLDYSAVIRTITGG